MVECEVPAAPILSHPEVLVDPQIQHNGCVIEAEHPVYGRYRRVRPAARFSQTVPETTPPAALYAEHADAILEELGCDADRRAKLRAIGAIK
jgi:crotonobetainyl-CoA:carnitine CoA-transferase CaiB-like acyl-CoA transferase